MILSNTIRRCKNELDLKKYSQRQKLTKPAWLLITGHKLSKILQLTEPVKEFSKKKKSTEI